uniref:Ig-like domain-containing protein n=1 Tax=Electrophorus electricus TaxID=8005 RepID=A0A4W4EZE9_ELEEL
MTSHISSSCLIAGMVCILLLFLLFHGVGNEQTTSIYVYWFKHTDSSVPVYISCQYYKIFSPSSLCYFVNQSKRIVMTVNSQNISLTIKAVNHTDSGLYYCGTQPRDFISFSNATYLQVTGNFLCSHITLLINKHLYSMID